MTLPTHAVTLGDDMRSDNPLAMPCNDGPLIVDGGSSKVAPMLITVASDTFGKGSGQTNRRSSVPQHESAWTNPSVCSAAFHVLGRLEHSQRFH